MKIFRVDPDTGQALFRLWGIADWPALDAAYWLFEGCIVAAIVRQVGFIDVHMAGKPGERHRAREAGQHIIDAAGRMPIRLIIKKGNRAGNMARRLGFTYSGTACVNVINGGLVACEIYWRIP